MANYPIKENPILDLAVRMFETTDRGHADIFNALGEVLINNDAFLNAMVGKMIEKGMITHVLDATNPQQVLGADVGAKITQLINQVDEKVADVNSDLANINGNLITKNYIINNDYIPMILRRSGNIYFLTVAGEVLKSMPANAKTTITTNLPEAMGWYGSWTSVSPDVRIMIEISNKTLIITPSQNIAPGTWLYGSLAVI